MGNFFEGVGINIIYLYIYLYIYFHEYIHTAVAGRCQTAGDGREKTTRVYTAVQQTIT